MCTSALRYQADFPRSDQADEHAEALAKEERRYSLAAARLMAGCIRAQAQPAEALDNEFETANSLQRAGDW